MLLTEAMDAVAAALKAEITDHPVHTDPSRIVTTPAILVGPPRGEPQGTLCGDITWTIPVVCVGLPGGRAELDLLAPLVAAAMDAIDATSLVWTLVEPTDFTPLVPAGTADPCQAYRITVEGIM